MPFPSVRATTVTASQSTRSTSVRSIATAQPCSSVLRSTSRSSLKSNSEKASPPSTFTVVSKARLPIQCSLCRDGRLTAYVPWRFHAVLNRTAVRPESCLFEETASRCSCGLTAAASTLARSKAYRGTSPRTRASESENCVETVEGGSKDAGEWNGLRRHISSLRWRQTAGGARHTRHPPVRPLRCA